MPIRRTSRPHASIIACDAPDSPALAQVQRAVSSLTRTCKVTLNLYAYRLTPKGQAHAIQRVMHCAHERLRTNDPSCIIFYHGRPNLPTILQVWHNVDDILVPSMSYHEVIERICTALVHLRRHQTMQRALQSLSNASDSLLAIEGTIPAAHSVQRSIASDIVVGFPHPYIYFRGRTSPPFTPKEMIVARMLLATLTGDYVHIDDLEAALFSEPPTASAVRRSTVRRYVSRTWDKIKAILGAHVDLLCRRGVGYMLRERT